MKILYLSQYFPPEIGAPAARVSELARAWAARGHEVTVLTGFPHHPTGVVPPAYRGAYFRRETLAGVRVVRVPVYAAANAGLVRRAASYATYGLSSAVLGPWVAPRPDVLIATSPQLLTAVAGAWVSAWWRCSFVFEVRDLWPRSIVAVGALPAHHPGVRALEAAERALYRRADRIVVVTHASADELAARGVPRAKLAVVTNGVDGALFAPGPRANAVRAALGLGDRFVALYAGTHGLAHGLRTVLEAARTLRGDPRFAFVLVGEGAEKAALRRTAAAWGLANVRFVDPQDRRGIPDFIAAADACLVPLRNTALFQTVIPSKLFEYMAGARPVVLGVDGEARRVVAAAGAGVFVRPESAPDLVAALVALQHDPAAGAAMGRRGRAYVLAHYARDALAERYLTLLADVARRRGCEGPGR